MITDMAGAACVLGVLGGILLSKYVPDETSWYPKWFFRFGVLGIITLGVVAMVFAGSALEFTGHLILTGLLLFALSVSYVWLFAIILGVQLALSPLLAAEVALVVLIPVTGHFWAAGTRKQFWWFAATPIIIIVAALL